jgi:hypothetical protein
LYMFGKQTSHDYARAYQLLNQAIAHGDEVVRPWLQKCRELIARSDAESHNLATTKPAPH